MHTNEPDEDQMRVCPQCGSTDGHLEDCPEVQAAVQLNDPPDDLDNLRWDHFIGCIEDDIRQLRDAPIDIREMPDAAGRVRAIERRLADLRHAWNEEQLAAAKDPESELGPGTFEPEPSPYGGTIHPKVVGTEYRTVTSRSAKRSFSTAPILVGISEAEGIGPVEGLMFAIDQGLAAMTWKWTPLKKYVLAKGLPMRVVEHPIPDDGDLDGPWVGELWSESVRQEAIKS